jgi:hypothetical protein
MKNDVLFYLYTTSLFVAATDYNNAIPVQSDVNLNGVVLGTKATGFNIYNNGEGFIGVSTWLTVFTNTIFIP